MILKKIITLITLLILLFSLTGCYNTQEIR